MHRMLSVRDLKVYVQKFFCMHWNPEAALAGILDCRFGGPHHYFGEYCFKPYIGNRLRPLTTTDMQQAVAINRRAEILMVLTGILLYLL